MNQSFQQKKVFVSLYITYVLYVYVRRCVTYALPSIATTENIGKSQLGLILSGQMLAYSVSKFFCGILVDSVSPKVFLFVGLFASSVTVLAFAVVPSSAVLFTVLWFLNGLASGPGWPSSALILRSWCDKDQFGTAWSILSTSMNVAGTLGPLITAYVITSASWRTSLIVPGFLSLVICGVVLILVMDKPPDDSRVSKSQSPAVKEEKTGSSGSILGLFSLPGYTGICLTYGVLSIVQYGTMQWGPLYLVQDIGHSIITGNSYVSSLEIGGIVGSVVAGFSSDFLLSKQSGVPNHIVRQTVLAWFASGVVVFLFLFLYTISSHSSLMWINFIGMGLGFTMYGPIALFGVIAMESAPSHLAGSAHAVCGLFSNGGQTLAGLPLSYSAKLWGWQTTFLMQTTLVVVSAVYLMIYTWQFKTQVMPPGDEDKKRR